MKMQWTNKNIDKWNVTDWLNQYVFEQMPIPKIYQLISERAKKAGQKQFRTEPNLRAHFMWLAGKRKYIPKSKKYKILRKIVNENDEYKSFIEGKQYGLRPKKSKTVDDSPNWSDEEIVSIVNAYFNILHNERLDQIYSKTEINRHLKSSMVPNRSLSSVELQMQNISAVLQELCHPIIPSYSPKKNINTGVSERIKNVIFQEGLLRETDYHPTHDEASLNERVYEILKKGVKGKPVGCKQPKKITPSPQECYERDPRIKAWVLQNAKGKCELCKNNGPFMDKNGFLFLEVHHVVSLSEGGSDTIDNTVALCPNCHRKCHYSKDTKAVVQELRDKVNRIP
jgi:5-methylcytosine-specific restriction protein A